MRILSDGKTASFLALGLIVIGLFLIYFWPQDLKYEKMTLARTKITQSGKWVEFLANTSKIESKTNGESVIVCDEQDNCVSVYFADKFGFYYLKGEEVLVFGEVSDVSGRKFILGHEIEIVR